jgi:hypothetical protein
MPARHAFLRWFIIGAVAGVILVVTGARSSGGVAGLLRVGDESVVRDLVESQLGPVPLTHGFGHDGQFFYAIGIDLTGEEVSANAEDWAYRYRRILYPASASLFGILDGYALLYSMIVLNILAMGVAAGAVAATASILDSSDWLGLAVILNPGVWLSVSLLTSDIAGLALMSFGLLLFVSRRERGSLISFVLSVLAKETFLVTPAGLAVSKDRSRWRYLWVPGVILILWMGITELTIGSGFATRGNLDVPLVGLIEAIPGWAEHAPIDWFYTAFTVMAVLAGLVIGVMRRSWLRWSLLGWCALAVLSSQLVWEFGNNSARAFLAVPVIAALAWVSPHATSGPTGLSRQQAP